MRIIFIQLGNARFEWDIRDMDMWVMLHGLHEGLNLHVSPSGSVSPGSSVFGWPTSSTWQYIENMVISGKIWEIYGDLWMFTRPGKLIVCELENGPVEIVD